MTAALRATRAFAAVLVSLALAACALRPATPDRPLEAFQELPERAWLSEGRLLLEFRSDQRRPGYAGAAWSAAPLPNGSFHHQYARLDYFGERRPAEASLEASIEIPVLPGQRWSELIETLLERLVPAWPDRGVLLLVRGREIVVYRDPHGNLTSVPAAELPPAVELVAAHDQEDFLSLAAGVLERYTLGYGDARQFLFQTEIVDGGVGYILVDLDRQEIIALSTSLLGAVTDSLGLLGLSVESLNSVIVRSHLLALAKNPFTAASRLINYAAVTTYSLVVPRARGQLSTDLIPGAAPPMDLEGWERDLDQLVESRPLPGKLELLIDGEAFFSDLLDAIGSARKRIDIRTYIFDRDDYAVTVADLLKRRSREVKVKVLVDDLGTVFAGALAPATPQRPGFTPPASIISHLKRGSEVKVRRSPNPWFTADHTKTIVIDNEIAYTGGMNIGREYRYEWHDLMVRLEGPIVAQIRGDFASAWAHAGPGGDLAYGLRGLRQKRPRAGPAEPGMIMIRPLYTQTGRREIWDAQRHAIRRAQQYIYIHNPYLSDNTMLDELVDARARGVDVRVILPADNDSGIMAASNVVTANTLLDHGIRVFVYPGMSHVKAAIYDGWVCLGTANFDKLSFFVNQEFNIAFSDPDAAGEVRERLFERDFAVSRELDETIRASWSDYLYEFVANQL